MKSITIKVTVPKKGNPWRVFVEAGGFFERPNAMQIYNHAEKRILALSGHFKIKVMVDYGALHPSEPNDWKNEGLYTDTKEALYALACFLEEYFDDDYSQRKYKAYMPV